MIPSFRPLWLHYSSPSRRPLPGLCLSHQGWRGHAHKLTHLTYSLSIVARITLTIARFNHTSTSSIGHRTLAPAFALPVTYPTRQSQLVTRILNCSHTSLLRWFMWCESSSKYTHSSKRMTLQAGVHLEAIIKTYHTKRNTLQAQVLQVHHVT